MQHTQQALTTSFSLKCGPFKVIKATTYVCDNVLYSGDNPWYEPEGIIITVYQHTTHKISHMHFHSKCTI